MEDIKILIWCERIFIGFMILVIGFGLVMLAGMAFRLGFRHSASSGRSITQIDRDLAELEGNFNQGVADVNNTLLNYQNGIVRIIDNKITLEDRMTKMENKHWGGR